MYRWGGLDAKNHRSQEEEIDGGAALDECRERSSLCECGNRYGNCRKRDGLIAGDIEKRTILREKAAEGRRMGIVGGKGCSERAEHQCDDQARTTARERFPANRSKIPSRRHHTDVVFTRALPESQMLICRFLEQILRRADGRTDKRVAFTPAIDINV